MRKDRPRYLTTSTLATTPEARIKALPRAQTAQASVARPSASVGAQPTMRSITGPRLATMAGRVAASSGGSQGAIHWGRSNAPTRAGTLVSAPEFASAQAISACDTQAAKDQHATRAATAAAQAAA